MTEIAKRESVLGMAGKNQEEVVNDEGDTAAAIDDRETSVRVSAETADGSQNDKDILTQVKALMAEPPTAKSARP